MRALVVLLLLAPVLVFAKSVPVAFLDFQYTGDDEAKKWYGPALREAMQYYLEGQGQIVIMPARQTWIHKENHKKGNKHSDIIRFGDFLDLDYLVSGEYTVNNGLIKAILNIWEIRTQNMHEVKLSEKETAFYRLATALSTAFLKKADAKAVFRQPPAPAVPPNVFGIFAKAVDAYAAGKVSDAVYAANRTLDFAPDFLPALALLADIYLLAGRPKAALKAVRAAVKADPHHCRTLAAYGEILSAGGRPDQALKVLKAEKSRCGGSYFFNAAFGRIYLEEGFFVIAISYLVKAISEYPAITELYFLLGRAYMGTENYKKAIEMFEKASQLEPKNHHYRCMLGTANLAGKRNSKAVAILEDLLKEVPDFLPATFQLSAAYNKLGWHKKAQQLLLASLDRNPGTPDLLAGLGVTLMHMDSMARAEGLFEKALALDPASPVVLNNFGVLMMKKKDFGSAAKFFKKALKYDKRNAGIFQNLGLVHLEMQDLKGAEKYLLLALESSPGNVEVRRVLKDIYIRREELKKAVAVLSEIIALDPTDTESKITYGDLLIQLGEREQGVGVYEDVVKNNPGNNQYLIKLANAYKGIEWYDIAILKLEKILKESPKSPGLLGLLGEIYFLKARSSQRLTGEPGLKSLYYLKNAYKLAPADPKIMYWYAKVLYECKRDPDTALPLFKKCLEQSGLDPKAREDIKVILRK